MSLNIEAAIKYLQSSVDCRSNRITLHWGMYERIKNKLKECTQVGCEDTTYSKQRCAYWKMKISLLEKEQKLEKKMLAHFIDCNKSAKWLSSLSAEMFE